MKLSDKYARGMQSDAPDGECQRGAAAERTAVTAAAAVAVHSVPISNGGGQKSIFSQPVSGPMLF